MDLTPFIMVGIIVVAAAGIRRLLAQLGLASDFLASLFVPPDRALGWPHGVQEQDTPWTWRLPSAPVERSDPDGPVPTQPIEPVIGRGTSLPGGRQIRR